MINKKQEKQSAEVVTAIKALAKKYGIAVTRTGVRRWDKAQAELKKLEAKKISLEKELAEANRRLGKS